MKKLFLIASIAMLGTILLPLQSEAQVTIGANKEPAPYSILEVVSTTAAPGGMRIPQVATLAERNAIQAKLTADLTTNGNGLTIYYLPSQEQQYWNGTTWVSLTSGATVGATNGLTLSSGTVKLGGNLTEPTDIKTTKTNYLRVSGADMVVNNVSVGTGNADQSRPDYNSIISRNVSIGTNLRSNIKSSFLVAVGRGALDKLTDGNANIAVGYLTGNNLTTGISNVFVGNQSGQYLPGASSHNTAVGASALRGDTLSAQVGNVAVGYLAGEKITTGANNTIMGTSTGIGLTEGSNNILIGAGVAAPNPKGNNQLNIGNALYGTVGATAATGSVSIGKETPATGVTLDVRGVMQYADGTESAGKVLTSDATGKASWQSPKDQSIPSVGLSSKTDKTTMPNPAEGLLVYNNGTGAWKEKGYMFWTGTEWKSMSSTPTDVSNNFVVGEIRTYQLTNNGSNGAFSPVNASIDNAIIDQKIRLYANRTAATLVSTLMTNVSPSSVFISASSYSSHENNNVNYVNLAKDGVIDFNPSGLYVSVPAAANYQSPRSSFDAVINKTERLDLNLAFDGKWFDVKYFFNYSSSTTCNLFISVQRLR